MKPSLSDITEFLMSLDELKSINRQSYISGGKRVENSAEHSWHLAMACWIFAEQLSEDYDLAKLMQLALVHDLGEIEAGDIFLYSSKREEAHLMERQGIMKIAQHPGCTLTHLVDLWDEQELGNSKEAKLLKVLDRLLPFLHNLYSQGRTWKKHHIHKDQVIDRHQFIAEENPEIYAWLLAKIDEAVAQGWLKS